MPPISWHGDCLLPFSALLIPGDIRILVRVGAVEDCGTGNNIIGKVRHVGAIMTYHYISPHEPTEDPVTCAAINPEMFPEELIFP